MGAAHPLGILPIYTPKHGAIIMGILDFTAPSSTSSRNTRQAAQDLSLIHI